MRRVFVFLLILLVSFLSVITCTVRISRATTTVYINADGSVFPPTAPLMTSDNVTYAFISNMTDASVEILRDNIILDGSNYALQGSVDLNGRVGVTVKGMILTGSVNSANCSNVTIDGMSISNAIYSTNDQNSSIVRNFLGPTGIIQVWDGLGDMVSENGVSGSDLNIEYHIQGHGIHLYNCVNCSVQKNTIWGCYTALSCDGSDIVVRDNYIYSCRGGISVSCDDSIVDSNTVVHIYRDRDSHYEVGYDYGLDLAGTNDTISHNLVANSTNMGVILDVVNSTVSDNVEKNGAVGFTVSGHDNLLVNNSITDNTASMARALGIDWLVAYGMILEGSNMTLRDNIMERNEGSFALSLQGDLASYVNDVDVSNEIDGRPIIYWVDRHSLTVPADAGYVALVNCSDMIARNLTLTNNGQGMLLAFTANSTITNNNVTANRQGIFLHNCSQAKITDNSITSNGDFGIKLESCTDSTVNRNAIVRNTNGIVLSMSNNTRVTCNTDQSNGAGLYFDQSSFCVVYHNNFIQNSNQVVIASSSNNTLDNGYPSGGNFWSDYTGVDAKATGLGFPYYIVSEEAQDMYPLMGQITVYDVTVQQNKTEQIDVESNSTVSAFQFNESARAISFNVEGLENTTGFCRITVPQYFLQDLWQNNLSVLVDGNRVKFENFTDTQNTYLFFTYRQSGHSIVMVPEYPSIIVLILFMTSLEITTKFCRKKAARMSVPKARSSFSRKCHP